MSGHAAPQVLSGGCQCGAVRYEASGKPKWIAHCHCAGCRSQVSGAYATWIAFPADEVRFMEGAPKLFASSPGVERGFCAECGTPLTYAGPKWRGELHLLVGSLDNPDEVTPTIHAYFAEALEWVQPGDGLPRYAKSARDGPPLA